MAESLVVESGLVCFQNMTCFRKDHCFVPDLKIFALILHEVKQGRSRSIQSFSDSGYSFESKILL